jgi:dTDP-4-amino-4,6-dideoxygalactose transaminase
MDPDDTPSRAATPRLRRRVGGRLDLREDRLLRPRRDDGVGDPLHPHERPAAAAAIVADDRLERVDPIGADVLPEPEEHHAVPVHDRSIAADASPRGVTVRSPAVPRIFLSPPHLTGREAELVGEAIASNWIAPLGPQVDAFERELAAVAGVEHAVALSSGTAALHLALVVLGIGEGDEVACSDLTFAASANAVGYTGATPFFVDCDEATWTLDPALLDRAITERRAAGANVRAVIAVDLYGQCCDYDVVREVCARHDVLLVQDAAESLGATYRGAPAGGQGVVAGFSFNGNKIITTSGGGMLVSENSDLVEHARKLSAQAREPVAHYEHLEVGFNYRMSNLLAALGRGQLESLGERVATRRRIRDRYRELLADAPGITLMPEAEYGTGNAWLTCIVVDPEEFGADRETIRLALEAEDIEARPLWKPMHLQPIYASHVTFGGDVSGRLFERGLCLPSGSALTEADQDRVVAGVLALRNSTVPG